MHTTTETQATSKSRERDAAIQIVVRNGQAQAEAIELETKFRRRYCAGKAFEALCELYRLQDLEGLTSDEKRMVGQAIQIVQQLSTKLVSEGA